jgi:hypothetical protein
MVNKYAPVIESYEMEGAGILDLLKESLPIVRRGVKSLIRRYGPGAIDWLSSKAKAGLESIAQGDGLYPAGKRIGMGYKLAGKGKRSKRSKKSKGSKRRLTGGMRRSSRSRSRSRSVSSRRSRGSGKKRINKKKKSSSMRKTVRISGGAIRF